MAQRSAGGSSPDGGTADARLVRDRLGRLKGVAALSDVSLALKSGDRLGIVGNNGSGKTTLLRVIAGLIPPDRGSVRSEGRINNLINLNLGVQSQATGHQNITLKGLACGASRKQIEEKRDEIAAFSELEGFLDLPVETYSAGMRMRLSFAIATAFDPDILALDEWLGTGDQTFRKKTTKRMRSFVDSASILVLASHSPELIRQNCNKALWLEKGRIRMLSDPDAVLNAYADEDDPLR
nr:ABC transporter ATP-binding protein [Parvularcula mediterranea]